MLIDESFLFLSIPRCASRAFEVSCINSDISIKYYNNRLIKKRADSNGIPFTHNHQSVSALRSFYSKSEYEVISIFRDPVERLISAWKYILGSFMVTEIEIYNKLSKFNNEEFINLYNKSIKNISEIDFHYNNYESFYKFFNNIIDDVLLDDPKFTNTKNIFVNVMQPVSVWTENDVTIRMFDIKHLELLEDYVKEKTGKDFKMERLNDTNGVITNLSNDNLLRDFYFENFEKKQKSYKSVI